MAEAKIREFSEDELYAVPETYAKTPPSKMDSVVNKSPQHNTASAPAPVVYLKTPERLENVPPNKSFFQENKTIITVLIILVVTGACYYAYKSSQKKKRQQ